MFRVLTFVPWLIVAAVIFFLFQLHEADLAHQKALKAYRSMGLGAKEQQRGELIKLVQEQRETVEAQRRNVDALAQVLAQDPGFNVDTSPLRDVIINLEAQYRVLAANEDKLVKLDGGIRQAAQGLNKQVGRAPWAGISPGAIKKSLSELNAQTLALMQKQEDFMQQAQERNEEAKDRAETMARKLKDVFTFLEGKGGLSEAARQKMDAMRAAQEDMKQKIQDQRERIEDLKQQAKERAQAAKERLHDVMENNAVKAQDARQRTEDMMQRLRDQAADRRN